MRESSPVLTGKETEQRGSDRLVPRPTEQLGQLQGGRVSGSVLVGWRRVWVSVWDSVCVWKRDLPFVPADLSGSGGLPLRPKVVTCKFSVQATHDSSPRCPPPVQPSQELREEHPQPQSAWTPCSQGTPECLS